MPLEWREQLSVHNTLIDNEHRYLIDQINAVERAMQSPGDGRKVLQILDHLADYTETHFRHEENIQQKIHYPGFLAHREQHRQLIDTLGEVRSRLQQRYRRIPDAVDSATIATASEATQDGTGDFEPLVQLLRSWLIDHIIGSDLKLKPYLKNQPEDLC